jgi:hypothetical protein
VEASRYEAAAAEKVAAWFLDSDYDGRCFCVCQAFFPDRGAWEKLGKALGGALDEEAFAMLSGTVSLPFAAGEHRRIAVKGSTRGGTRSCGCISWGSMIPFHRTPQGSD